MGKMAGKSGRLMVGGRVAATLADWEMEPREGYSDIVAHVLSRDSFWLEHGEDFTLMLDVGTRVRVYKNPTVYVGGGDMVNIKTREA
jgi:hypothetical protein